MNTNNWNILILFFCLLISGILFYKKVISPKYNYEGFSQNEKFVLMKDKDIYDDFYSEIYEHLHVPDKRINYEIKMILDNTQTSTETSVFLDVGSGTGNVINELNNKGFQTFGIEQSGSMIEYSKNKYPEINIIKSTVEDPMAFEAFTFSHILCLYYTIYHFRDKKVFFRNCYKWLKPGGYLIIHLVDKEKYNMIIPVNNNTFFKSNKVQSKQSVVDFVDFKYKIFYQFIGDDKTIVTETFTDTLTSNIRQNENIFYMEDIKKIIELAKWCGFIPHGIVNLKKTGDENQYLYFFERSL